MGKQVSEASVDDLTPSPANSTYTAWLLGSAGPAALRTSAKQAEIETERGWDIEWVRERDSDRKRGERERQRKRLREREREREIERVRQRETDRQKETKREGGKERERQRQRE
jgi:hypothetical protein